MDEFINDLKSVHFWIGVVFVGLLIHLGAAYIKGLIDARLEARSNRWRIRCEKEIQERKVLLNLLRADPYKQLIFAATESRYRYRCLLSMIQGIFYGTCVIVIVFLGLPIWLAAIPFIFFVIIWIAYLYEYRVADRVSDVLRELHSDLPF